MDSWIAIRSTILDEILSLDGPCGRSLNSCNSCSSPQDAPLYRCLECSHSLLNCAQCTIELHKIHPLHRLEVSSFYLLHRHPSIQVTHSSGKTGSSKEPPFTRWASSATLGTMAIHVPRSPRAWISRSLTSMDGMKSESCSAPVMRSPGANDTSNYSECAGTRHLLTALKRPSPSIYLKCTTSSRFRAKYGQPRAI